jgi:acetyl esterase/lipase
MHTALDVKKMKSPLSISMAAICAMALGGTVVLAQSTQPAAPNDDPVALLNQLHASENIPTPPPPDGNTILLWPNGAPNSVGDTAADKPRLEVFKADDPGVHSAVIIMPGGGYRTIVYGREGREVARWFNNHGVTAFILNYRLAPRYLYPTPQQDGARAIRWVRSHASEYGISPAKIGVVGFSAGGHLAGYLGTHFDMGDKNSADPVDRVSSRPDFAVSCYGLHTLDPTLDQTQSWSLRDLLGPNPSAAALADVANDKHVTAQTSPFFLYTTSEDSHINSINSAQFYEKLRRAGVPAELHIFAAGPHGVGFAQDFPSLRIWPLLLDAWMQTNGWMSMHE